MASGLNSVNDSHDNRGNAEHLKSLLITLGNMTNMNEDWCKRCLEETGWNLQMASDSFTSAKAQGKVPPDAFK